MVVTSHSCIDQGHPTGLWFEEFAVPYGLFRDRGYGITVASPRGGDAPLDPGSMQSDVSGRENEMAFAALKGTRPLDASLQADDFDAIFFPGGHGTMFDLPDNPQVQRLVSEFAHRDKILASVCHGPACLVGAMLRDGTPLVKGRRLTAFTDHEERAVGLDGKMPFLLETRLRELGAEFIPAENWHDNVVVDGRLVTGQNPRSSAGVAQAVIRLISAQQRGGC